MKTTLTTLEGLKREIAVELANNDFLVEVKKEINKVAASAKIDGFRPGKVPPSLIEKKYGNSIKSDIAQKIISDALPKVFEKEGLTPAATPNLIKLDVSDKTLLKFSIVFEIFPEVKLADVAKLKFEQISCDVSTTDVDKTLQDLRKQKASYQVVKRAAKIGDKVNIDFVGRIGDKIFEGGQAEAFELILGDKKMVPGFEDGIIGNRAGDNFAVNVRFSKDYNPSELRNKKAVFNIKLNAVSSAKIPPLDDELAQQFQEKNLQDLKKSAKKHIQIELEKRLNDYNKEKAFHALLDANKVEVPASSVEEEAQNLLKDMQKNMDKQATTQNLSADLFTKQAEQRLQLGVLINAITKNADIKLSAEEIKNKIVSIAKNHNQPEKSVVDWYYADNKRLSSIESGLLEDKVLNYLVSKAKVNTNKKTFQELVYKT